MSIAALNWARGKKAGGPGPKCVLLVLADYADDQGECWPSQARIAEETEQSVRTVRRQLQALAEAELVQTTTQWTGTTSGQATRRNRYRLAVDGFPQAGDNAGDGGQSVRHDGGQSGRSWRPRVADEPPTTIPHTPTVPTRGRAASGEGPVAATQAAGRLLAEAGPAREANPCPECGGERFIEPNGPGAGLLPCPACGALGVQR